MRFLFFLFFGFGCITVFWSQSLVGKWKTVDDATGKERAVVEISLEQGKLYGKVLKIYSNPGEPLDPVCVKCKDYRKDKKIMGMEIISGLRREKNKWVLEDGILDPEKGKLYDCKLWLKNKNILAVRGYIGFFYRTQYWYRTE